MNAPPLIRARRRRHDEEDLQEALVEHLKWRLAHGVVWYAVPNGEKRDKITASKLKRLGVRAGGAMWPSSCRAAQRPIWS